MVDFPIPPIAHAQSLSDAPTPAPITPPGTPPPSTPKPSIKMLLPVLTLVLLSGGLFAGITVFRDNADIRSKASEDDNVNLTMAASPLNAAPGDRITLQLTIQKQNASSAVNHEVSALSIPITYPADKLSLVTTEASLVPDLYNPIASNTDMLKKLTNSVDGASGSVTITLGAPCTTIEPWECYTKKIDGPKTVTSLIFEVKSGTSGEATFNFDMANTHVASKGQGTADVVTQSKLAGVNITIAGPANTPIPTIEPTVEPTAIPTVNVTPVPTVAPPPAEPGTTNINIKVKAQGISSAKISDPVKTMKVMLYSGTEKKYEQMIKITNDAQGVYTGFVQNVAPGTYDVYLKGWAHLQKKFAGQIVESTGETTWDLTGAELIAGDTVRFPDPNAQNVINELDRAYLIGNYNESGNFPSDINLSGRIDAIDLGLLVGNLGLKDDIP